MDDVQLAAARTMARGEREAMAPWLTGLRPWSFFVTFTYDPVKVARARGVDASRGRVALRRARDNESSAATSDRLDTSVTVGLQKLRRDIARFVGDSARAEGRALDMVAGFEPHLTGSLHAHALAYYRGDATGHEVRSLWASWFDRHGYIEVAPVGSSEELAAYVVKNVVQYCTKGAADLFFSRRLSDARF